MSKVEERLAAAGITIPEVPVPLAAYVPGVVSGNMVHTSGQLPMANGALSFKGKLGDSASVEDGYAAAKQCAVNCLGVVKALIGNLDRVKRVVKVVGFVNSAPDFEAQPKVINGRFGIAAGCFRRVRCPCPLRSRCSRTAPGRNVRS